MQERISKAIITASYDDDGKDGSIEDKARKQYEKEVKSGYYLPTHIFLRDKSRHKVTKFNFLMPIGESPNARVPMIDFAMLNTSKSDLESIAVVGDRVTEINVKIFRDYFHDEKVRFGYEGEDWSFSRTLNSARKVIQPSKDEVVLILMGDTPLKYDFDKALRDPDIADFDFIADCNSRRKTNKYWPRKYHAKLLHRGRYLAVKEPQILLANLSELDQVSQRLKLEEPILDMLYSSRKAHGNKGKSRQDKFREIFAPDVITMLSTLRNLGPIYIYQLGRWVRRERGKPIPLNPKNIYNVVKNRMGIRFLMKADNDDPSTIEDIDGLADWANLSEMLIRAGSSIYPHYNEILEFGEKTLQKLRVNVDFYNGFEDYMNSLFKGYGLPEPFVAGGKFVNPFTSSKVDEKTRLRSNRIIRGSIKRHKRYLRKTRIRRLIKSH